MINNFCIFKNKKQNVLLFNIYYIYLWLNIFNCIMTFLGLLKFKVLELYNFYSNSGNAIKEFLKDRGITYKI